MIICTVCGIRLEKKIENERSSELFYSKALGYKSVERVRCSEVYLRWLSRALCMLRLVPCLKPFHFQHSRPLDGASLCYAT